jgi:hypothetical protein
LEQRCEHDGTLKAENSPAGPGTLEFVDDKRLL